MDNAKYRRLRGAGVTHRQAVAMALGSEDFASGGGESVDLSGYQQAATAATDTELASGLALKQDAATAATDAELSAAIAGVSSGPVSPSGVRLARSTDLAVASAVHVRVPFETASIEQGEWWDVANPSYVTIPANGWYVASAHMRWLADPGQLFFRSLRFGAAADAPSGGTNIVTQQASTSADVDASLAGVFYATAGQVVWLNIYMGTAETLDHAIMAVTPTGGPKGDTGPAGGSGDAAWTALTLQNGWTTYSADYPVPSVRKLGNGQALLRGCIKPGTTTQGTVVFTLPAGYRPGGVQQFRCAGNLEGNDALVRPSGAVEQYTVGGTPTYFFLDSISFFVEG